MRTIRAASKKEDSIMFNLMVLLVVSFLAGLTAHSPRNGLTLTVLLVVSFLGGIFAHRRWVGKTKES